MVVEVDRGATGACGRPSQFCAQCAAPSPLQPAGLKIVSRARRGAGAPGGARETCRGGRRARGATRGRASRSWEPSKSRTAGRTESPACIGCSDVCELESAIVRFYRRSVFQSLRCWHDAHHGCPSLPPPAGAPPRPRRGRARRGAPFRSRARVGRSRAASTRLSLRAAAPHARARRDTAATQASSSCTTARATPGGRRRPPATSGRASST